MENIFKMENYLNLIAFISLFFIFAEACEFNVTIQANSAKPYYAQLKGPDGKAYELYVLI